MHPLIRDNLEAIAALCKTHRVKRLFLVGSALNERFDAARSDVDFIVVFEPFEPQGWDDPYFKLREALQTLLGRQVDLIEARTLRNPYLIASLNRTKKLLYAA
jgi:predicted nucleotidyltransferase